MSSAVNNAFWHKSQRSLISNMCLNSIALTMNGSEQTAWAASTFMIGGEIRNLTVDAVGADTILVTGQMTGGLHANNPVKTITDDGSTSTRTVRQNFCSLSVAAYSHVYCLLTVEKHGTDATASTLQAQGHWYAGEIVGGHASHANGVQTARRPDLDLTDECLLAEIYFNNTSAGALVVGAATSAEYMGGSDGITLTAGSIKNVAFVNSL